MRLRMIRLLGVLLLGLSSAHTLYGQTASDPRRGPDSTRTPSDSPVLEWDRLGDGTLWRSQPRFTKARLVALGAVATATAVVGTVSLTEQWYREETGRFHHVDWYYDLREYGNQDKLGHFFTAYVGTHLSSRNLRLAGDSGSGSVWRGAVAASIGMVAIEVADGFFERWGFSTLDFTTNLLGVGYAVVQQVAPKPFGGIAFKFSYHTSQPFKEGDLPPYTARLYNDYEGQTYWLTMNPASLLPERLEDRIPAWIRPVGVALGHGVRGLAGGVLAGEHQWYVGLDLDFRRIPVGDSRTLRYLMHALNIVRPPLPTVRIAPSVKFYPAYF